MIPRQTTAVLAARTRELLVLGTTLLLAACARPLPVYGQLSTSECLAVLAERAAGLRNFSGAGTLTVHDPEQGTVTLEAAAVGRKPDQLRVRAWKLGRSVADITLDGDDVAAKLDGRVSEAGLTEGLRGVREVLLSIDESFYALATERPGTTASTLVIQGLTADGAVMLCEVDRRTLTLRAVRVNQPANASGEDRVDGVTGPEASILLQKYREIDGTVWPMRVRAARGGREATLRFDWVELNADIVSGALPDQQPPTGER